MLLTIVCACLPARAEEPKTAEQVFHNIQVLKGTPAEQLRPGMQFVAASLGVECDFCHVQGKFEADDKRMKQTARRMMAMTLAINHDSFHGQREVTCYSCHHGNHEPERTPPVAEVGAPPADAEPAAAPRETMPTADQVLDKYLAAVGGADALHKITSRTGQGKIIFGGQEASIELFAKAPDKRMSVMHSAHGDSITAFDGHAGWLGNGGQPPHDMVGAEIEAVKLDAEFYFPARVKQIFDQVRMGHPEKIAGHPAYTLIGQRRGQPPVRLYFDEASGLLVRLVRYADTPLGRNPTQIDYADYRAADGIKLPFRWTLARPGGRFTIQLAEVQQNVAIPDEKFAWPQTGH